MIEKFSPISGSRFWREFHATGFIHADMGDTVISKMDDPRAWIEHTIGEASNFIRPESLKRLKTEESNADIHAHAPNVEYATAASSHFPPHLQMFIVPPGSDAKLTLQLLDSWALLQEAENRSADFYLNLFNRIRVMRYEKAAFIAPTFSIINGRLIFAQPPKLGEKDKLGERVKNWVSNREPMEVEISAGEMLILDNHRYAKKIRENSILDTVESYSVWTEQITNHPNEKHIALAQKFKTKLGEIFPTEDAKTMIRFGLLDSPLDDYIRAFLDTPTRLDALMPIYRQVFNDLYDA
jgi:hypothetical protein